MTFHRLKISGAHFKQLKMEAAKGHCCVAFCGYRADPTSNDILVQTLQPMKAEDLHSYLLRLTNELSQKVIAQAVKPRKLIHLIFAPPGSTRFDPGALGSLPEYIELFWCPTERDTILTGYQLLPHPGKGAINSWFVSGDDYLFYSEGSKFEDTSSEMSLRHQQMFGEETTRKLRSLKIGVVGCSGTGGPTVEQLGRLGVGHLVIIDPDKVEYKNLNRIPNSTFDDAVQQRKKVHVFERTLAAIGYGTKVEALPIDLVTSEGVQAIASCDVVFGCMDSVLGRHVLNRISSYYLIPLIDLGVKLSADGKGGISAAAGAVHCIQPGGSSLMSRMLYDSEDLRADTEFRQNPELYRQRQKEGYIKNVQVDSPAVMSFNMQIAALGVSELLARIHPSMRLDSNDHYAILRMNWMDAQLVKENEPEVCPIFSKLVGKGDCVPLLGMPSLSLPRAKNTLKEDEHVGAY